jgi:hypothetical protein
MRSFPSVDNFLPFLEPNEENRLPRIGGHERLGDPHDLVDCSLFQPCVAHCPRELSGTRKCGKTPVAS